MLGYFRYKILLTSQVHLSELHQLGSVRPRFRLINARVCPVARAKLVIRPSVYVVIYPVLQPTPAASVRSWSPAVRAHSAQLLLGLRWPVRLVCYDARVLTRCCWSAGHW